MAGRIDVTVVVPCFNTETYLDQALSSIEANDRCALEILAINDGSTDGSLAIMRSHEAADSRVRVIDKPNQGYGATVNRGFAEARGTYVAIVEPDDWVEPHMYDDLVDFARAFSPALGPDAPDMVKTPYWRVVGCNTGHERKLHCIYYGRVRPKAQRRREVTLVGPPTFQLADPSALGATETYDFDPVIPDADVVYMLRVQLERMEGATIPSRREYNRLWGLTDERHARMKEGSIVMHPGPMNRGMEIAAGPADAANSFVTRQVASGLYVRMAAMYLLLGGE